jgi:hypothetical protein
MATSVIPPAPSPPVQPSPAPGSFLSRAATFVAVALLTALIVDAAVETLLAASPARWVVAGIAVGYLAVLALFPRRGSGARLVRAAVAAFLAMLVCGAWWSGGPDAGVALLRQTPTTAMGAALALAIIAAGWTTVRAAFLPVPARVAGLALAAYGLISVADGIVRQTAFASLLHGGSVWTRLPFWLQGAFLGGLVLLPVACLVQLTVIARARGTGGQSNRVLAATGLACSVAIAAAGFVAHGGAPAAIGRAGRGPGLKAPAVSALSLAVPRTMDLAHVDPGVFAAALGNDPGRVFEFVRDQIAYEPYRGALRGPRGTLLALAGNSVDRAALLGALLAGGRQRLRFAHGRLPDELAQDLVASTFEERPDSPASASTNSATAKLASEQLSAGIERDVTWLTASLKNAGLPGRAEVPTLQSLLDETREHYWVQMWRDGGWVDMDPSFAAAVPGQAFTRPTETLDALPESLFHRVDVSVTVEEYEKDRASNREVLHFAAKAADLSGIDLVFAHAAGLQPGQVKPVLMVAGQRHEGAPFSVDAPANRGPVGFQSLFGGGDEPAPAAAKLVSAESVAIVLNQPGGGKDAVTREIFDLVGPAARVGGRTAGKVTLPGGPRAAAFAATIGSVYDFFVTTGAVHEAHLEKVTIPPAAAAGQLLDVRAGLLRANVLFAATSDRLLARMVTSDGGVCRFYPDSPRVQVMQFSVGRNDVRLAMDLRRDTVRTVGSGTRREHVFGARVLRGVAEGHLERLFTDFLSTPDADGSAPQPVTMSTSLVFEKVAASKAPIVLLERDVHSLSSSVPADGRARVEQALAEGWVAVAPKDPVQLGGAPRFGWWQVERRSGSTIAVTDAGLHQATVELSMVESEQNGKVVVFEGAAAGQGQMSYACAHPTTFANAGKAYEYCNYLMNLMKSNNQLYHFTHYLTEFAL